MIIRVHLDEKTTARITQASAETGRSIDWLAADAVSEYMINGFRDRKDDPGRDPAPGLARLSGHIPNGAA